MTTTTTTHPERVKLPICPPWCAGHNGRGYQSWWHTEDGGQKRDHGDDPRSIVTRGTDDIAVGVIQREDGLGVMSAPSVDVYVVSERIEITAAEARKVAAALLEAADRADGQ